MPVRDISETKNKITFYDIKYSIPKTKIKISNEAIEYKIALLGKPNCGKTSLITRLCRNGFYDEYDPTIEEIWRKEQ